MGIIDQDYLGREYDVRGMSFHSVGIQFSTDWPLKNANVRAAYLSSLLMLLATVAY
jgi:hypothetical protein